jgi:hypothetical protein
LAKESPPANGGPDFSETSKGILDATIAANSIAANDAHVNAYEMRNALLETRRKARVRYKNGETLPATAAKLLADAERKVRHSRILARNIKNATGVDRHVAADAHHIVAQSDKRAKASRDFLFDWGIGINDAVNGVYLPKKAGSVPGMDDATAHEIIHTSPYHLEVWSRLRDIQGESSSVARVELREMASDMVAGEFPY